MPSITTKALARDDARVIDQHIRAMLARCRVGPSERDDLAQSAWLRLLSRLEAGEDVRSLEAYAAGVARNVWRERCAERARRAMLDDAHRGELEDLSGRPALAADDRLELVELAARLEAATHRLTAAERWLIDARLADETSYAELLPGFVGRFGRVIRTPEGLRTATFHARKQLAATLGHLR